MDLVNEEDRAGLQCGQQGGDVALALKRRAGSLNERHTELGGDDLRQRSLSKPGRPGEQNVIERFIATACRLERNSELVADGLLADKIIERLRPQRAV